MTESKTPDSEPELFSPVERDRIVRLCMRLSGSAGAAEDLAQETLLEAWKARDRLRDASARAPWLAGIARNVCRRRYGRLNHTIWPVLSTLTVDEVEIHLADDLEIDLILEQSEITDLLGRAL